VRHFLPDPVPQQAIDDMLDVARWSGSASNRQPWEFVVVRDKEMLQALGSIKGSTAGHLARAPLGIFLVMSGDPARAIHEAYDDGRLSERIMLTAAAHGLGSCIGWFTGDASTEAKRLLGVPEDRLMRTVISIGYPDREAHEAARRERRARQGESGPRKPLSELVHRERYCGQGS
jgi:nitroreductase